MSVPDIAEHAQSSIWGHYIPGTECTAKVLSTAFLTLLIPGMRLELFDLAVWEGRKRDLGGGGRLHPVRTAPLRYHTAPYKLSTTQNKTQYKLSTVQRSTSQYRPVPDRCTAKSMVRYRGTYSKGPRMIPTYLEHALCEARYALDDGPGSADTASVPDLAQPWPRRIAETRVPCAMSVPDFV
eukprot:3940463-Rhodomonas_salina.2